MTELKAGIASELESLDKLGPPEPCEDKSRWRLRDRELRFRNPPED